MNFIVDNYLWFGIIGVILVMALIGFLAEKTNFINSSRGTTTPRKKKTKGKQANDFMDTDSVVPDAVTPLVSYSTPAPSSPVQESVVVEDTASTAVDSQSPASSNTDETIIDFDSVTSSMGTSINDVSAVPESMPETPEAPVVSDTGEDLSQPFGDVTSTAPVMPEATPEAIFEAPVTEAPAETVVAEPVPETNVEAAASEPVVEAVDQAPLAPDTPTVEEQVQDVAPAQESASPTETTETTPAASEEDIWKF